MMRKRCQACAWLILLCAGTVSWADEADERFARLDAECFNRMPATISQCERYVAELKDQVNSSDDARLLYAAGLSRLSNFADDPELSAQQKEEARVGLVEYLAMHPNDLSALYELVGVVDGDEQIEVLKRIVGFDRDNAFALRLLVRGLSIGEDEDSHLLGLRYLEQGYQETTGDDRLSFGSWMFEAMVASGRAANAVQIQQRIKTDFNFAKIDWSRAPSDTTIAEFCKHDFLVVQLEQTCIDLIYASAADSIEEGHPYGDSMLEAIELVLSSREALNDKYPEIAFAMRDVLEDHPDDARKSGYYYLVYSLVVTRDKKIAALRAALGQGDYYEPRIRYWLGVALKEQGQIEQAADEFEKVMRGDDAELAQVAEFELSVLENS